MTEWSIEPDKIFLLLLVLVLSIVYLLKSRVKDFPDGPICYPFIGSNQFLQTNAHIRLTRLKEKYGDIYSIQIGKKPAVIVCSLEGIEEGLLKKSPSFGGRPRDFLPPTLFNGCHDGGIIFSELNMKYKIKKDFVLHSLDKLCCSELIEGAISREARTVTVQLLAHKGTCDLYPILESTMLRILLFVVNGKMYSSNDENFQEIWRTFSLRAEEMFKNWSNLNGAVFQSLRQKNTLELIERTRLHFEYQRDIVNRHKDCFNPEIVSDVIDHGLVMLERYDDMGQLDQDELDALFVELCGSGYRQVAATLQWLVLYISEIPDVQGKVYDELMSVVGKNRLPYLLDQPYLPYTCAVIMETQRLATVMPFMYPHSTTENTSFMGYQIPKDTIMLFNLWSLHHDPKHWKHPMKFDPDRFLKDGALHIPDHYLPFGDGLRSCPGESLVDIMLFIFATHLLHQLSFKHTNTADLDGEFNGFVLKPKSFRVIMEPRDPITMDTEDIETQAETVVCFINGEEI
ncbi:cytochrome P450 1B1-like [Ruditapes philippinarum]|uniref:cytochrome P450 1B1-like n=1 Tax=Ruditapes philippinarum TaxID=129788 RepID=UPI00295B464C|nr:cytochrome P450 1B1-like [Ruditapes philippinarum]